MVRSRNKFTNKHIMDHSGARRGLGRGAGPRAGRGLGRGAGQGRGASVLVSVDCCQAPWLRIRAGRPRHWLGGDGCSGTKRAVWAALTHDARLDGAELVDPSSARPRLALAVYVSSLSPAQRVWAAASPTPQPALPLISPAHLQSLPGSWQPFPPGDSFGLAPGRTAPRGGPKQDLAWTESDPARD